VKTLLLQLPFDVSAEVLVGSDFSPMEAAQVALETGVTSWADFPRVVTATVDFGKIEYELL
jgi:hypothetical protein